jgi:hypothetical protein
VNLRTASEALDLTFEVSVQDVEALRKNRPAMPGVNLLRLFERSFPPSFFFGISPRTTTSEGWPEFEL